MEFNSAFKGLKREEKRSRSVFMNAFQKCGTKMSYYLSGNMA